MPDQAEITKAALAYFHRHGEQALGEAEKRIAELEQFGQGEARALWVEIRLALIKVVEDANPGAH